MEKQERIIEYSKKYKAHQLKLSKGIMIFLLIIGILIIAAGLFVSIYEYTPAKLVVGIIMILTGIFNIPLGFKFNKVTTRNINNMPDKEAYSRYCKIYGLDK